MTNPPSNIILPRRQFLKKSTASIIAVGAACSPAQMALGKSRFRQELRGLLRMHPARLVAGLVFDVVETVVVDYLAPIVSEYIENSYHYFASIPEDRNHFNHNLYREAVIKIHPIRTGMTEEEYQHYRAQKDQVQLSRDEDLQRFEIITRYLTDIKAKVYFPEDGISQKISAATPVTHLFNGDLKLGDKEYRHYRALLENTEVSVFDKIIV